MVPVREQGQVPVSGVRGKGDGLGTLPWYYCQLIQNNGSMSPWANLLRKGSSVLET